MCLNNVKFSLHTKTSSGYVASDGVVPANGSDIVLPAKKTIIQKLSQGFQKP